VLIDLSGRLRYLQNDVVRGARARLPDARSRQPLAQLFLQAKSTVGATQTADDLFAFPGQTGYHETVLRLIAASGQTSLLPQVVRYLDDPAQSSPMRLFAAEIIRVMGLPQPPRPNPAETLPDPAVTPEEFYQLVRAIDPERSTTSMPRRQLPRGMTSDGSGVVEDCASARTKLPAIGCVRNPSPYNITTSRRPTHAGIVAPRDRARRHPPLRHRRRAGAAASVPAVASKSTSTDPLLLPGDNDPKPPPQYPTAASDHNVNST
jgi:hypothetical protein